MHHREITTTRHATRRATAAFAVPRTVAGAALAAALCVPLGPGGATAQEETPFESLPTGDLIELYVLINDVLQKRGVLPSTFSPTDAYASWLVRQTLELSAATSPTDMLAQDGAGERYLIASALERGGGRLAVRAPAPDSADLFAVVLFTADHRVQRAAVAPVGAVIDAAEAGRVDLARTAPFWRIEGLRDLTPRVYRVATDNDLTIP